MLSHFMFFLAKKGEKAFEENLPLRKSLKKGLAIFKEEIRNENLEEIL